MAVTLLLVGVSTLLTWPLLPRLGSAVTNLGDPLHLAWDLHALGSMPLRLFDANIFHPHRWALAYSEHLLGLVPLAGPVALAGGGPILAHNVVLFSTFPLTGLTMFLLVRHLTGSAGAGAVAGILYAFSHYRFGHLSHVQVLSHQWLPLMLLGVHRAVEGGGRWRDVALAGAAFCLQALSSGYSAYFTAVALALFGVWVAAPAARPPLGHLARRGLLATAAVAVLLAPAFVPYYVVRREAGFVREHSEMQLYSARLVSYLASPPGNRWLGSLTARFRHPEGELFPGAVMLALALTGVATALACSGDRADDRTEAHGDSAQGRTRARYLAWPRWLDGLLAAYVAVTLVNALVLGGFTVEVGPLRVSQRHFERAVLPIAAALLARRLLNGRAVPVAGLGWLRRLGWPHAAGYYVGLTVIAVLCSFGPSLALDDWPVVHPLYQQLATRVPGFDAIRVPARFAMLASTGLAVLAGYGVAALARVPRRRTLGVTVAIALGGLAVLEAWAAPLPYRDAPRDLGPADRWLASTGSPGAVAVLPMYGEAHREARRLLGSTAHWRPLVNGYASFFPPGYWETVGTVNTFPAPSAVARLRDLGVRYVVVHLGEYPDGLRARLRAALRALPPGIVQVASFDGTVIFEVRSEPQAEGRPPPAQRAAAASSSARTAVAAAAGSGAVVMGRPTTM